MKKIELQDIYIYNGLLDRENDLSFIRLVSDSKKHKQCLLVLLTTGGSIEAAYKIARFLQHTYKKVRVLIPGLCKSAGTLLAMGAHELIFTEYGELGPLDVQMRKVDQLARPESGLNISEAVSALEAKAIDTYHSVINGLLQKTDGGISLRTANQSASEMVSALYGPVFRQIELDEFGAKNRAMKIGYEYGARLNERSGNLKDGTLDQLAKSYPDHAFVIDYFEAKTMFNRVRWANKEETVLVASLNVAEISDDDAFMAVAHRLTDNPDQYRKAA